MTPMPLFLSLCDWLALNTLYVVQQTANKTDEVTVSNLTKTSQMAPMKQQASVQGLFTLSMKQVIWSRHFTRPHWTSHWSSTTVVTAERKFSDHCMSRTVDFQGEKTALSFSIYTLSGKNRGHIIFNYNSCISWSIFYNFCTIGNRNKYFTTICNLLT